MFAPEGYYRWIDVYEYAERWAAMIVSAHVLVSEGLDPRNAFGFDEISAYAHAKDADLTLDLLTTWFLAAFMKKFPPFLSNSSGTVMQSIPPIWKHADHFAEVFLRWPYQEMDDFSSFYGLHKARQYSHWEILDRFVCIDPKTGMICEKDETRRWLESGSFLTGPVPEYWIEFIQAYSGWALCRNEKDVPDDLSELFEGLGLEQEAKWLNEAMAAFGSVIATNYKSKENLEHVLACVLEAYPEGKSDFTWQEVEERVGYSRRHILRALRKSSKTEWATSEPMP